MTTFTQVADRVWVARFPQWQVNVGLVAGSDRVLLVDCHASLRRGQQVADLARSVTGRAVDVVAVSHVHFDHSFGLGAFPQARTLAHRNVIENYDRHAEQIKAACRAEAEPSPEHGYDLTDLADVVATPRCPPAEPVESEQVVDLGDRAARIRYAGRGHTDGDVVVTVSDAPVAFAGDLIEQSAFPSLGEDSFPLEWAATLRRHLDGLPAGTTLVPGHGIPVELEFCHDQADALERIARVIRERHAAGMPLVDAAREPDARLPVPITALTEAVARGFQALDSAHREESGAG